MFQKEINSLFKEFKTNYADLEFGVWGLGFEIEIWNLEFGIWNLEFF